MFLPSSLKNVVREKSGSPAHVSAPGLFIFFLLLAAGLVGAVLLNQPAPVFVALVIGVYLLFAIKVAEQWEKVAVLRLGRYRGLRGPGLFHHRSGDRFAQPLCRSARARDRRQRRIGADPRHRARECGRHCLLGGVGRGEVHPRSGGLRSGHHAERADRAARIHRTPRAGADDHRARNAGPRAAAHPGREDQSVGNHRAVGRDPRRAHPARRSRTPCRARRRPSASARRASSWARRKPRSPTSSRRPR